jgi:hypothetical protein
LERFQAQQATWQSSVDKATKIIVTTNRLMEDAQESAANYMALKKHDDMITELNRHVKKAKSKPWDAARISKKRARVLFPPAQVPAAKRLRPQVRRSYAVPDEAAEAGSEYEPSDDDGSGDEAVRDDEAVKIITTMPSPPTRVLSHEQRAKALGIDST